MAGLARVAIVASILAMGVAGAENNGAFVRRAAEPAPVARIIVGLRPATEAARAATPGDRVRALSARAGMRFRADREIGPAMRVVELETPVSGADLADTLARLASDPDVAFAEPDGRVYRHAIPNDPFFVNQWYLQNVQASALDAVTAWDTTQGGVGEVVAILDTGVRFEHPDLLATGGGGRLLAGFDFIGPDTGNGNTFIVANDGDGWDADPSDPGDWVTPGEASTALFAGCEVSDSSWHGTRVAGLIGAITNNNTGIAGVTWTPSILPVRVLGKCFGSDSDILQGMRWAAGITVAGAPVNPFPAKIVNVSLGSPGACPSSYRTVLGELAARGVLVVASAGNSDGPVERPGNCPGVVAVAGLRHLGTKVAFSSYGAQVTLAAPGGNCVNTNGGPCLFSLETTTNDGLTLPASSTYTDQFNFNVGTSFSAPFVSAIAALMQGVNAGLAAPNSVTAPRLIARLREGAQPFPAPGGVPNCRVGVDTPSEGCACTTSTCGAGMANAPGSVTAALRPVADIAQPGSVAGGQDVVLDGTGSAAANGRAITTYAWTEVCGAPTIAGGNTDTATVLAPMSGSVGVRLTVTDDQAAQDSTEITIENDSATLAAPGTSAVCTAPGGGGGGGGSLGLLDLLLLVMGAACRSGASRDLKNRGLRRSYSVAPTMLLPRTAPPGAGRTHPLGGLCRSRAA